MDLNFNRLKLNIENLTMEFQTIATGTIGSWGGEDLLEEVAREVF